MKKHLLSPQKYINNAEQLHSPGNLMQQEEEITHVLIQRINTIVANSSVTSSMLLDIAYAIGIAFNIDCCLVTVVSDTSGEAITTHWCSEQFLNLPPAKEMLSQEELLFELPVVQCADKKLTIEDISIIQKTLVNGWQNIPLPMQAVLAISTRFGGHSNGVISLIKFRAYEWHESEIRLLQSIESCCAIAFAQIAQSQILTSQKQHLHKANQHQSLIQQLTILNRSNLELNQMLQLVITSTAEALEADRGLLILFKYTDPLFKKLPKQQIPNVKASLVGAWTQNAHTNTIGKLDNLDQSFWVSDCSLCQLLFTDPGKPIMTNNCEEKNTSNSAAVFAIKEFPHTMLMPLESQGKVLGFVVLQQTTTRNWETTDLNLIEMLCAQLSDAVIQSQTLRQVQNLVDERTEQLKRSLEVQAKLYERTRQYVEQLQQLNELKDEFVSNISDRLRYPLTNMLMSIRNLRLPGITPERQDRYLNILESECTKEINLINDLLTLQKLESHQEAPQFESLDLKTKIQNLLTCFDQQLTDKDLSISVELPNKPLKLQTEVESFDRIIQELLTNVCKYSEHDTTVHVRVTPHVVEELDQVIIKVTNTGRGISEEEAAYIFDKFRRGKGRWIPGTGLGLAICKQLVELQGGEIFAKSKVGQGSTFAFQIRYKKYSEVS
ncbi:MAG: GAF domain-containing sensor histidine kinase, partial [Dolichospermum sp.]|nr:GAF domain-containing sensor histidine kinase [Dolichospermum sp.]